MKKHSITLSPEDVAAIERGETIYFDLMGLTMFAAATDDAFPDFVTPSGVAFYIGVLNPTADIIRVAYEEAPKKWIQTPRGSLILSNKTRDQLAAEGFGLWFEYTDTDGKRYFAMSNYEKQKAVICAA